MRSSSPGSFFNDMKSVCVTLNTSESWTFPTELHPVTTTRLWSIESPEGGFLQKNKNKEARVSNQIKIYNAEL